MAGFSISSLIEVCTIRTRNNLSCRDCMYKDRCVKFQQNHEGMTPYDYKLSKQKY